MPPRRGRAGDTWSSPRCPWAPRRERQQPNRANTAASTEQHRTDTEPGKDSTARASPALPAQAGARRAPRARGQKSHGAGANGKFTLHCSTSPPDLRTAQGACVTTQTEGDTVRTEESSYGGSLRKAWRSQDTAADPPGKPARAREAER